MEDTQAFGYKLMFEFTDEENEAEDGADGQEMQMLRSHMLLKYLE